jgi:uncharacterized YccA/Bax inhibitor family protein
LFRIRFAIGSECGVAGRRLSIYIRDRIFKLLTNMESSNPLLSRANAFEREGTDNMTFDGALGKTAVLLLICTVAGCFSWAQPALQMPFVIVGSLGGFVVAMVAMFKAQWSPVLAPTYALLEGLALGAISYMLDLKYHGIVLNAVLLTFGVLALMLLLFTSRPFA